MRALVAMTGALVAIVVTGCGPIYQTRYQYTAPADAPGKMCAVQCQQNQTYCRATCQQTQQTCLAFEHDRGMHAFEVYAHERRKMRAPIKRTPDSFVENWRCSASSCEASCAEDYRQCFTTCGGRVDSEEVCTAFCEPPPAPVIVAPAAPSAPPLPTDKNTLCAKGRRVQAYSGNDWYDAVVKAPALPDGRCPVHYDGFGSDADENVLPSMLRSRS